MWQIVDILLFHIQMYSDVEICRLNPTSCIYIVIEIHHRVWNLYLTYSIKVLNPCINHYVLILFLENSLFP